ncbi:MAG: YraN family protein [Chlorobiaceae bacterium]|nr:YraN family protein [Chlorobiaceae bacterium]NTW10658.1 YraN family protein [Chlorobiaceae bacterium]
MNDPRTLGPLGEKAAADYLRKKGYRILERNYRFRRNEIDIIATDRGTLCFIEVKTRSTGEKGDPLEAVTPEKQKEIIKAAKAYLAASGNMERECRFDVIALRVRDKADDGKGPFSIEHVADAFWATQ